MAFSQIDATKPAGTDKKKFGDDVIREFKQQVIDNLKEITNYPASAKPALKTAVWTTATRPTGAELVDRVTGYNTDLSAYEYYDSASATWKTLYSNILPAWNVAGRPTGKPAGYTGYNVELNVIERWNGTAWIRIAGGRRGDIKMWSGSVSDIEVGWVLCDGKTRNHPEGGTFTPPDLRDRFIAGAGGSYAVGATGGEAFHTLTVAEMPNHSHTVTIATSGTSGVDPWVSFKRANLSDGLLPPPTSAFNIYSTGGNQPHENRPPYYALCFLYKL
ncbi:hypothetical protein [Thermosinus carboxydivorans]|nr:hypothetical protein [Thermosinus carboxydivorans]